MKVQIHIDGITPEPVAFELAECWDDVPAALYPALATLYVNTDGLNKYDKTVRAFAVLAIDAWATVKLLDAEHLYDLLSLIDWVFNRLDLQKNILPSLQIAGLDFFGPADGLRNLRFAEWCAAETFMMNYIESDDIYQLQQLAATLYRPAGEGLEFDPQHVTWRGDRREKFNDNLLASRTQLMAEWLAEPVVLKGIYLFYQSCRKAIINGYPVTFPDSLAEPSYKNRNGWLDIYDDLRSDPKYAAADLPDEEMLLSVLFSLERYNIKMNELKEKYP